MMPSRCFPKTLLVLLLAGSAFSAIPLPAHAGGTIAGKVTFSGTVPAPKEFKFSRFSNSAFCRKNANKSADGETRLLREVQVAPDGGLKHAVVSVRNAGGKDWLKSKRLVTLCESTPHRMPHACAGVPRTEVLAERCEFVPYTGVVVDKGKFYVENHDADPDDSKAAKGVLHSPHGFEVLGDRTSTLFNIPLPREGDSMNQDLDMRMIKEGSAMRLQCDQHEFMQSWFLPVDNPYYATVSDDGTFEIRDVPAGVYTVLAWHPVAGKAELVVEVPEGGTVEAKFDIRGKK